MHRAAACWRRGRSAAVAVLPVVVVVVAAVAALAGTAPAAAQAPPEVVSLEPAAGTAVRAGPIGVHAHVRGPVPERAEVAGPDGVTEATIRPTERGAQVSAEIVAPPGRAILRLRLDGAEVRAWEVTGVDVEVHRLGGRDRLDTAITVSRADFTDGAAEGAVLARADDFADALAGAALASALGGPLLLTPSGELAAPVASELQRSLAPDADVVLLGGERALSGAVAGQVAELGVDVHRISGGDRFATAVAVAARLTDLQGDDPEEGDDAREEDEADEDPDAEPSVVLIASGEDFPDAVAAAAPSVAAGWPLLLTAGDGLPAPTAAALTGVDRAIIIGGTSAVSAGVEDQVRSIVGQVERLAGPTRAATSVAVADSLLGAAGGAALAAARDFPDALAGGVHAGRRGLPVLLADPVLHPRIVDRLAGRTGPVVVYGGDAAVAGPTVAAALAAIADTGGPRIGEVAPAGPDLDELPAELRVRTDQPVSLQGGAWMLTVDGRPLPASARTEGADLVVVTHGLPGELTGPGTGELRLTARLDGDGGTRHLERVWSLQLAAPTTASPEGWTVAGGRGSIAGDAGVVITYSVEVEPAANEPIHEVRDIVERWLSDTERGWPRDGRWRLQRVGTSEEARIRVVLARPATVDAYCARVGLNTAGRFSCWDGRRAMLNLGRWRNGAPPHFTDVATYRGYLVNHEVGHGLGLGHVGCPARGAPAPVMMQQTIRIDGCRPNPYPFP